MACLVVLTVVEAWPLLESIVILCGWRTYVAVGQHGIQV